MARRWPADSAEKSEVGSIDQLCAQPPVPGLATAHAPTAVHLRATCCAPAGLLRWSVDIQCSQLRTAARSYARLCREACQLVPGRWLQRPCRKTLTNCGPRGCAAGAAEACSALCRIEAFGIARPCMARNPGPSLRPTVPRRSRAGAGPASGTTSPGSRPVCRHGGLELPVWWLAVVCVRRRAPVSPA